MNTQTAIVKDLMSKYNLTDKDLFSFCICAVNFLEYYYEESMYDMMYSCPERYAGADSDNRKAVAGALTAEKKTEKWTDADQFANYMESIQEAVLSEIEEDGKLTYHFLGEMERFKTVYRREIMIPFMLGCKIEDYDDTKFSDEKYLKSIANMDGLLLYKAKEEENNARMKKYEEEQAAKLAKEIEEKKNDKDFTVLLASSINILMLKAKYEKYNETYYPDRGYEVKTMPRASMLIIQTGGKSIEDAKETIMKIFKSTLTIVTLDHKTTEELVTVEDAYNGNVPKLLKDNGVTHVIAYY